MHKSLDTPALARLSAAFACALPLFFAVPGTLAAEITNQATVGYDSFIDRFTILEADTFETVQDLYVGLGNSLYYRSGAAKAGINSLFRYGNQTVDERLDAEGSIRPLPSTVIDLRSAFAWKHFREGSDYEFGNDYTQANATLRVRTNTGRSARLSLKSRMELTDYKERTEFDYDYRYVDGGAEWDVGTDVTRMLHLGLIAGRRDVPDTTALSYNRLLAELEARYAGAGASSFQLFSAADRREYRESVRSSYWYVTSQAEGSLGSAGGAVLSLRVESEILSYDRPDSAYFDTHFLRAGIRARFPVRTLSAVYVEPRYAVMLCKTFAEERYREISLALGGEVMSANGFWLSVVYEPGFRDYELDDNALYSDFYLNRLSAMGSIPLPAAASLNIFVTHEPERHSRREDDFSITLVSIDLTKRF